MADNNPQAPAVNQLVRLIHKGFITMITLLVVGLFISYHTLVGYRKKTNTFQSLVPENKLSLFVKKNVALMLGSCALIFIPHFLLFAVCTLRNGMGHWNHPIRYFIQNEHRLYFCWQIVSHYFLWLILFTIFWLGISLVLNHFFHSILLPNLLFFFLIFFTQSKALMESTVLRKFLPSSYLFIADVFLQNHQVSLLNAKTIYYQGSHEYTVSLFTKVTNNTLAFLAETQGLLLVGGYAVLLLFLSSVLVARSRRLS